MKSLIIVSLLCSWLFANPTDWFVGRMIPTENSMEIIGYGSDIDPNIALLNAKTDISSQIKSTVNSSLTISKQRVNDTLESNSNQISNETTDIVLEEAQVVRQQFIEGKWYVAVSYETMTDVSRFIKKLPIRGHGVPTEPQNAYFSQTIVGKELNKLLKKTIDAKVYWKSNTFFLNHGNVYQRLNPDEYSIPELFITGLSGGSSVMNKMTILKSSQTNGVINSYENCEFKFVSEPSKKYVSLFAINPEGAVLVLENNIPVKSKTKPYQFFRKGAEERPTMFVAVFSTLPEDNSYFRIMQGTEERESYSNGKMKFDKFIDFLDGKDFIAQKMLIK